MIDFKIKGTKLPVIPKGIEYSVSHWTDGVTDITSSTIKNLVSFGTKHCAGEEWILAEKPNFRLKSYFMFKLSDIEHLAKEQGMMGIGLPQYWVVKSDTSHPDWRKVIDYLNKTYSQEWSGGSHGHYYGFDGNERYNGTDYYRYLSYFKNNPTVLTIEEFVSLTNQKTENMITIKREQLKSIHDIACTAWQEKIKNIAKEQPFGEIELSQSQIDEMFKAAQSQQLPILEEIFGKQIEELDFRSKTINFKVDDTDVFGSSDMNIIDSFISLPICEEDKNMFFLNPNYNWELCDNDLIVTRKKIEDMR